VGRAGAGEAQRRGEGNSRYLHGDIKECVD
jgi:hypothetical protein